MSHSEPLGRRERKKAATRKAISDTATMMFLERGFDNVSIREVADAADVSPTTVFAHFPQKEALVFDEDDEQRDRLIAVVRDRPAHVTINDALRGFYADENRINTEEHGDDVTRTFMRFLDRTPVLRDYAARMWLRHESALAEAIAVDLGADDLDANDLELIRVYARFVMQMQTLVSSSEHPMKTLDAGFSLLEAGWAPVEERLRSRHQGAGSGRTHENGAGTEH